MKLDVLTELIFRTAASGVLGSVSQALRHSRPRIVPLMLLPALGHVAEFLVHHAAGTPPLTSDLRRMPSLLAAFIAAAVRAFRPGHRPFGSPPIDHRSRCSQRHST